MVQRLSIQRAAKGLDGPHDGANALPSCMLPYAMGDGHEPQQRRSILRRMRSMATRRLGILRAPEDTHRRGEDNTWRTATADSEGKCPSTAEPSTAKWAAAPTAKAPDTIIQ